MGVLMAVGRHSEIMPMNLYRLVRAQWDKSNYLLGLVVPTCNLSTQKVAAGELLPV